MIILIDLDGTLIDTAHSQYKNMKDGKESFVIPNIPIFKGALEFIRDQRNLGHLPIIISDSHPNYVNKIAKEIFDIPAVCLTDKPNMEKTLEYIEANSALKDLFQNRDNFIMIGDSWLDIELGRRLNVRTVLTKFYKSTNIEVRDGIGEDHTPIKIGPTYYATTFSDLHSIIKNPGGSLLALEALFHAHSSHHMVKFHTRHQNGTYVAFRCLARQEDGECDRFARADKYYQIDNPARSKEFIQILAQSVTNCLVKIESYPEHNWDYISYVSDKKTTTPPNKMKEIFDFIETGITKVKLFEWSTDVTGSLRNQPDYKSRRSFISTYLNVIEGVTIGGKNIIIIDDQFTSSATANEIASQLRSQGAKNILFIALFYLILPVNSKDCPAIVNGKVCGKPLKIKINKRNGNKFYSCLPPKFRGTGCGYIENIVSK